MRPFGAQRYATVSKKIEAELRDNAQLAHSVTGCSLERHLSTRAANEITRLKKWIREVGSSCNICTYGALNEICYDCECERKPSKQATNAETTDSTTLER